MQQALLDEVEPLLFGYARSFVPGGDGAHERAVALTHELAFGFHLRVLAGGFEIADNNALRALAHRLVAAKLAAGPVGLADLADPETNRLTPALPGLGVRVAEAFDAAERAALASRLLGEDAPGFDALVPRLVALRVLPGAP